MSCEAEIHLNDIGTVFRTTIKDKACDGTSSVLDVSAATTLNLIFKKPGGTVVTKSASFTTDGTDGQIEYITVDGDLDEVGNWQIQAYIVLPSGSWRSDKGTFYVHENL